MRELSRGTHQAIRTFVEYVERADILVRLTYEGLARIQGLPDLVRLARQGVNIDDKAQAQLTQLEKSAAHAKTEEESEFPFLHAHSLVGLWGALECLVEDLFMARLEDEPSLLGTDAFKRIKLPASLMIESDASERHRAILSEMARSTDADLAQGTGKFERLLAPVGLGGAVPKPIKDAVFHAQQVRNIWAHRAGAADRRFVERCPNLGFRAGERVDIDLSLYRRLTTGIHTYGFLVGNRCRLVRGLPPVPVLGVSSENEDVSVASDVEEDGGAASPLT